VDCSIVIVNYRTEALLAACLDSLASSDPASVEVIVVDNSATLERCAFPARFPWVRFVESPGNVGFARACNHGMGLARGRHLLLLNPDTVAHPGAVETLWQHLDAHPEAGAVAAKLLNPDGSLQYSCRRFPRYYSIFFGRYSWLSRWLPGNPATRDYLYLEWDHAQTRAVDWVSGACLMVRREVLERVGPLDEGYFLFVEDMDWCRRIRDAGYEVVYTPQAVVTHHIGASRGPVSARIVWERHQSMLRYVCKHFRPSWPLRAAVATGLTCRAGVLILAAAGQGAR